MISQMMIFAGRAVREPAVHSVAALASVPAAAAGLHAVGMSTDVDPGALANGLFDPRLWITLGVAATFGGLGGIVAELISLHGRIELPHRVRRRPGVRRARLADARYEVDLGVVSRVLLGAAAALALLSLYAPTSATALVVNALIAGSAATGVFRVVQGRLLQGAVVSGQGSVVGGQKSGSTSRVKRTRGHRANTATPPLTIVRSTESSAVH